MRPGLRAANLTQEDAEIWGWSVHRKDNWAVWRSLFERSRKQDRRDAELMLSLRKFGFIRRTEFGTVFCLPSTLREWYHWTPDGVMGPSLPGEGEL